MLNKVQTDKKKKKKDYEKYVKQLNLYYPYKRQSVTKMNIYI